MVGFNIKIILCFDQNLKIHVYCNKKNVNNKSKIIDNATQVLKLDKIYFIVCFDSFHTSQQFSSHVGTGLPGLNHF